MSNWDQQSSEHIKATYRATKELARLHSDTENHAGNNRTQESLSSTGT